MSLNQVGTVEIQVGTLEIQSIVLSLITACCLGHDTELIDACLCTMGALSERLSVSVMAVRVAFHG